MSVETVLKASVEKSEVYQQQLLGDKHSLHGLHSCCLQDAETASSRRAWVCQTGRLKSSEHVTHMQHGFCWLRWLEGGSWQKGCSAMRWATKEERLCDRRASHVWCQCEGKHRTDVQAAVSIGADNL